MLKSTDITIRPAVRLDIEKYDILKQRTLRAMVWDAGGNIIGIAGVFHSSPPQAFFKLTDELRRFPMLIVKGALGAFRKIINLYDVPVYAIADDNETDPGSFLEKVGFVFYQNTISGRYYLWVG